MVVGQGLIIIKIRNLIKNAGFYDLVLSLKTASNRVDPFLFQSRLNFRIDELPQDSNGSGLDQGMDSSETSQVSSRTESYAADPIQHV